MRYLRLLIVVGILAFPLPSRAQNVAAIAVDVQSLGKMIPVDFDGFGTQFSPSPENNFRGAQSSPIYLVGGANQPNRVFYQLLKNLGGGTLRSVDGYTSETCWNPSEAPYPEACPYLMTDDFINGYVKASAETGWGVLVAINLAQNSAPWAIQFGVRFADAARATPGSKLVGFEFGNEPDIYTKNLLFGRTMVRPPGYSWQDLVKDWKPYVAAFKANPATAGIPLVGPVYDQAGWTESTLGPFIDAIGAKNLGFVTVHHYATSRCDGRDVTIPELLSEKPIDAFVSKAKGWVETVNSRGLDLVHGETNSVSCEGQKGVSDAFALERVGARLAFYEFQRGNAKNQLSLEQQLLQPGVCDNCCEPGH